MRFEDKVAIVSGGAAGLGEATALAFHNAGAKVVVIDLDEAGCEALRDSGITAIVGDASEEGVYAEALAVHGRVDALYANAGISCDTLTSEIERSQWDQMLAIHLNGAFHAAQTAFRAMAQQGGGSIVFASSPHAIRTVATSSAYAAAKAGVLGLMRSLAVEGAPLGVRVNAVLPGAMDTPMVRNFAKEHPDPEATLENFASWCPMGRLGRAEEIAAAVLFLCSDAASYITGTTLAVDGGLLASL